MQMKLHYRHGELYYINGEYVKDNPQPVQISLHASDVLSIATNVLHAEKYIWQDDRMMELLAEQELAAMPTPELVYAITQDRPLLAYRIEVFSTIPLSRKAVYVDPTTKEVVITRELTCSATGTADTRYSGTRSIETEMSGSDYISQATNLSRGIIIKTLNTTGLVPFTDNDNNWTSSEFHNANSDDAALDAHWGMEMTYDYFKNVHNRDSYNNAGGTLQSQIHFNSAFGNARWIGAGSIGFGDSDVYFDIMTSLDWVAHEIGHAISGSECSLGTVEETGAINEGLSDIWGVCVEYYTVPTKQRWQIGEDVELRTGENGARSISNPNSTGQPDTYLGTHWITVTGCTPDVDLNDNCGVHTNMSIMSHWFFRLTEGGSGTNDNSQSFSVTGIGIEDAAEIVYKAETDYMTSSTNYANMRTYTIKAAQDIFGYCSQQVISVIDAWHAVGVGSSFNTISNIAVTANIPANTTQDFYSPDILEASNTIDDVNTNIRYRASGAVILKPGFVAEAGSNFVAEIVPCVDLSASKKERVMNAYPEEGFKVSTREPKLGISIYPNPMDEYIYIVIKSEETAKGTFAIMDITGREIIKGELTGLLTQINTQKIASGNYIISTQFNENTVNHKLVKP